MQSYIKVVTENFRAMSQLLYKLVGSQLQEKIAWGNLLLEKDIYP